MGLNPVRYPFPDQEQTMTTAPTFSGSEENMLLALPDDEFKAIVNDDLRKQVTTEMADALRSPAVFDRWWGALVAMTKSLDGQLGSRRAEYRAEHASLLERMTQARWEDNAAEYRSAEAKLNRLREQYHRTRAGSLRFKSGLDEWMVQAATIRRMRRNGVDQLPG
jgi:hypothetical protein